MTQYIDKSALVAEIERKKAYAQTLSDNAINSSMQQFYDGMKEGCNNLLSFLNTIEVNLWQDATGDNLPPIDKEVIVLTDNGKVCFAHRPNPNGWDGKSITTGKIEHYTPQTYGKGGWNIPDVVWWLDLEIPANSR